MKAAVIDDYGTAEALQYREVQTPTIADNQVLVKVKAASVNPVDWKVRRGDLRFIPMGDLPRIMGADFAGEVVEVGGRITAYRPGDAVYGSVNPLVGGAYAEFVAAPENAIARKPEALTFAEAAAIPIAGVTALQALRDEAKVTAGQSVLINGASGGVGTFAVQIAKALGASVTAVCSQSNFDLVRKLGEARAIDYRSQNFSREGIKYDVVFDVAGKRDFSGCRDALTPDGTYISTLPNPDVLFWSLATAVLPGQTAKVTLAQINTSQLTALNTLIDQGKVKVIIDRSYPLAEIRAAHLHSETEHVSGKIVLTV